MLGGALAALFEAARNVDLNDAVVLVGEQTVQPRALSASHMKLKKPLKTSSSIVLILLGC